jgi:AcrR family transcriptional regulator
MAGRPNLLAGEALPPKAVQRRSMEKQLLIKAAGLAVFGEKGYANASIGEIARRAGLAVGGIYLHFRSKRQLLLVLMDELLEGLSRLNLAPNAAGDAKTGIRELLAKAFSHDLRYLGAYRAWREAVLSDSELARKQLEIQGWTSRRVALLFRRLQQVPKARPGVDVRGLAIVVDSLFWSLLSEAATLSKAQLRRRIDSAAHLIHHGLFADSPARRGG